MSQNQQQPTAFDLSSHTITFEEERPRTIPTAKPPVAPTTQTTAANEQHPTLFSGFLTEGMAFGNDTPRTTAPMTTAKPLAAPAPKTPGKGKGKGKKSHRARAPVDQDAHLTVVMEAAQKVTEILSRHGLSCAVFGSLASKLYGCARTPKDVDMLVSQESPEIDSPFSSESEYDSSGRKRTHTAQALKDIILLANSQNFYLKLPRDPAAEYRILWYRQRYRGAECKVDILIPGAMHLPFVRHDRVVWKNNIPLVPFSLLLFHKLQGWDDHCKAEEAHHRRKHQQDAADVRRLLGLSDQIAALKGSPITPLEDEELFDEDFRRLTKERVKRYCEVFPDRTNTWKAIGIETS